LEYWPKVASIHQSRVRKTTGLDFLLLIIPYWVEIRQDFDSSLHEIFKKVLLPVRRWFVFAKLVGCAWLVDRSRLI